MHSASRVVLPRLRAIVVGVLAVGAAVGAAHLLSGVIGPNSSPYVAVANSVVQLTQGPLKEIAVQAFGTADKPLLLAGIGVLLLLLGIVAGLLSRRSPRPGAVLIGGLGVVGLVAAGFTANLGVLGYLPALLSLLVGVGGFVLLHRIAGRDVATTGSTAELGSTADPEDSLAQDGSAQEGSVQDGSVQPAGRRRFFAVAGGVAVGALAAGGIGQWLARSTGVQQVRAALGRITPAKAAPAIPADADFAKLGSPTFITPNADFYRVDTAITLPQIDIDEWRLRIHGMVDRERVYTFDDIRNRELVERTITMTCVSNQVGGPYVSTANFIGVPLRELLDEAGVRPGADQLYSTSEDSYTAGTPMDVVLDRTLLAIAMNGEPLPVEHGFPVRMVTPGLYGYLSATKWVVDMEATTFAAKQAYWIPRGYSMKAPIKTQSRIDAPGALKTVPAGKVTVAGIAWAQPKGIQKVEVQVDDGRWQQAELAAEVNDSTWRMWRTEFELGPGFHTVRSRATDKTGYTQTDRRVDALPNGATGLPSIQFSVS